MRRRVSDSSENRLAQLKLGVGAAVFRQIRQIPIFLRISGKLGWEARFDLHAAALANDTLKVKNPEGNNLSTDDCRTALAPGLTFRYRF